MPVTISDAIEAPLARVWEIVADFEGLMRWHPLVVRCDTVGSGTGAIRTVHFEDWWAKERLDRMDQHAHVVAYTITDCDRTVNIGAKASITLTPLGPDRTRIDWVAGLDAWSEHAEAVNAALTAYYPVRIGHLKHALGLAD